MAGLVPAIHVLLIFYKKEGLYECLAHIATLPVRPRLVAESRYNDCDDYSDYSNDSRGFRPPKRIGTLFVSFPVMFREPILYIATQNIWARNSGNH